MLCVQGSLTTMTTPKHLVSAAMSGVTTCLRFPMVATMVAQWQLGAISFKWRTAPQKEEQMLKLIDNGSVHLRVDCEPWRQMMVL